MNPPHDEIVMLHRLAVRDRAAFLTLCASEEVALSSACFHGQQAVEKLFKAVLTQRGIPFPPTHNLERLAFLLEESGLELPVFIDLLRNLNPYAVVFRYSDLDVDTLSREEATNLVAAIFSWAEGLLGEPSPLS